MESFAAPFGLRSPVHQRRIGDRQIRIVAAAALIASLTLTAAVAPFSRATVSRVGPALAAVPGGLVQAIHHQFGPGSVGLATDPTTPAITASGSGWTARIPSASVSAVLTPSGTSRVTGQGHAEASLRPIAVAAGTTRQTLGQPSSSLTGGRLSQSYGAISSSFQATQNGLEQRFVVPRPLSPQGSSLTISLGSQSRMLVDGGGRSLSTSGGGSRLVYGGLRTTDRTGRVLPSHFVSIPGGTAIVVATRGAQYPITVDPTWVTVSQPKAGLTSSTGKPGDYLGFAVSLSADGTTALVGAYGTNSLTGAAYVFEEPTGGPWVYSSAPVATLTNGLGAAGDRLGVSVALSPDGTTAVVGADGASGSRGAADVFTASSEGAWASTSTPAAVLSDSTAAVDTYLGASVDISSDGTTALVGAYGANTAHGSAEIFSAPTKSSWASTSTPVAVLTNASGAQDGFLGYSASLSADGKVALVGSFGASGSRGAADVFTAPSETGWTTSSTPTAILSDSSLATGAYLGQSVSLSADGTTALAGAWGGGSGAGQGDVFRATSETTWKTTATPTAVLTNGSGVSGDRLGIAAALSSDGTTALLGAPQAGGMGAADVFAVASETAWAKTSVPAAILTDVASQSLDLLGGAVALSSDGSTAMVDPYGARSNTGTADVFVAATVPGPPVLASAVPGNTQITVTFTRPVSTGNAPISSYAVTATDVTNPANGGESASGPQSPLVVTGLTNGDSYTVTVTATNAVGTGPPSPPSKPAVPKLLAPRVTTLSPSTFVEGSSNVPVVLTGLNLVPGTQLFPLGGGVLLTSVTVVNGTTIDAVVTTKATAAVGSRNLTVEGPGGTTHCNGCFTVAAAPTLISLSPSTVVAGTAATLTLTGSGIEAGASAHAQGAGNSIKFAPLSGTGNSATSKVAVATGTAAGVYSVVLTNPDHSTATCTNCLTITG